MKLFGRKSRDDSPVTDEEVLWAYRIALGREPESARTVAEHRRGAANLLELRRTFFNSIEFRNGMGRTIISQIAPTFGATTAPDIVSPWITMLLSRPAFLSANCALAKLTPTWSFPKGLACNDTVASRVPSYTLSEVVAVTTRFAFVMSAYVAVRPVTK